MHQPVKPALSSGGSVLSSSTVTTDSSTICSGAGPSVGSPAALAQPERLSEADKQQFIFGRPQKSKGERKKKKKEDQELLEKQQQLQLISEQQSGSDNAEHTTEHTTEGLLRHAELLKKEANANAPRPASPGGSTSSDSVEIVEAVVGTEVENVLMLVCNIYGVPLAMVASQHSNTVFLKQVGVEIVDQDETWRQSFCHMAMDPQLRQEVVVVPDASLDVRYGCVNTPLISKSDSALDPAASMCAPNQ